MSMTAMGWLCALLLAAAPALPAEEWSQFRGPNGRGVAEATGLPVRFGPAQNVIWKTRLPPGHSSPVLGGERVFLTAFEGDKLLTFCLDRGTGDLDRATARPAHQVVVVLAAAPPVQRLAGAGADGVELAVVGQ